MTGLGVYFILVYFCVLCWMSQSAVNVGDQKGNMKWFQEKNKQQRRLSRSFSASVSVKCWWNNKLRDSPVKVRGGTTGNSPSNRCSHLGLFMAKCFGEDVWFPVGEQPWLNQRLPATGGGLGGRGPARRNSDTSSWRSSCTCRGLRLHLGCEDCEELRSSRMLWICMEDVSPSFVAVRPPSSLWVSLFYLRKSAKRPFNPLGAVFLKLIFIYLI